MGVKKRRGGKVSYVRNDGSSKSDSAVGNQNVKQLLIDYGDGHTERFMSHNGRVFIYNGDEVNKTMDQLIERAASLGYKVKTYTEAQAKEYEKSRKEERAKSEAILDQLFAGRDKHRRKRHGWKGH